MQPTRKLRSAFALAALLVSIPACRDQDEGPVRVVAIGGNPALVDPNRFPLSPASALLLEATAQGLVRFDAAGEIEPALAQSWIVSDDGLRYTFRLRQSLWTRGENVTAAQVVERLKAALGRASRNPLKPVLGAIEEVEAMTDRVLEIRLKAPRPNFLQLLAQPEMAIIAGGQGTGPYRIGGDAEGAVRLTPPPADEEADAPQAQQPDILLSADTAAQAIAAFARGQADLVTGGTTGDLPLLLAADVPEAQLAIDPTRGLFGLSFARGDGLLAKAGFRRALSMALDREAVAGRLPAAALQPRNSILPMGLSEVPQPALPDWNGAPLATRREEAARLVREEAQGEPPALRVALPDGLGYRLAFAQIRHDWRMIGVDAVAVPINAPADLRLIDEVAPADLASWYLRHFICGPSPVCDESATLFTEAARLSPNGAQRQVLLRAADRALMSATPFIPISSPIRWSLRTPRLNAFRVNVFGRHALTELVQTGE